MITKLVESNHYHIWTDAIHARQLARQTSNKWDRATYVRWTILTSWIVLEMACQDVLGDNTISYSFQRNLDRAVDSNNLPALNWGKDIWQQVKKVHELRKDVVHRFASEEDLFPEIVTAEETIVIIREAIKAIYLHCGKSVPEWVDDDSDEGWTTGTMRVHATGTSSPYVEKNDAIKVVYVYKDKEHIYDYLSPDTDINQPIDAIFKGIGKPITAVLLYRGNEVLIEYVFERAKIRGA